MILQTDDGPFLVWSEEEIREAVKVAVLARRYGAPQHNNPGGLKLTATREEAAEWRAARLADRVMEELMRDGS